ncbi:MAG: hypothetical protein WAV51_01950 [Microgenomates group bacterium]
MTALEAQPAGVTFGKEHEPIQTGYVGDYIPFFMELAKNPIYTKELFSRIDTTLSLLGRYEDTQKSDGITLTGSLARYLVGNGDPEDNWIIREDAAAVQKMLPLDSKNIAVLSNITKADQDIDMSFRFTEKGSLPHLYEYLKKNLLNTSESVIKEYSTEKNVSFYAHYLTLELSDSLSMKIRFGPIGTNPVKSNIVIGFHNSEERLFHIDISAFPQTAKETEDQKRQGGPTIDGQNIRIPLSLNDNGRLMFTFDENTGYNLVGKEHIFHEKMPGIVELANRALRIHLIHAPETFTDTTLQQLTQLLYTEDLFKLRQIVRDFTSSGGHLSNEAYKLLKIELLIAMSRNPRELARFLQDTKIADLVPGLADFTHDEWKKFHTSNSLMYLSEGKILVEKQFRSMDTVKESYDIFKSRSVYHLDNGIKMFLQGFGEVIAESDKSIDPNNLDQLLTKLFDDSSIKERPNSIKGVKANETDIVFSILKREPGGMTENELFAEFIKNRDTVTLDTIDALKNKFKKTLFYVKAEGDIDKVIRYHFVGDDKVADVFYHIRQAKNIGEHIEKIRMKGTNLENILRRVDFETLQEHLDENTINQLIKTLPYLSYIYLESYRPMRPRDIRFLAKEMSQYLKQNHINEALAKDNEKLVMFLSEVQKACISYSRTRGR